jgi:hypothetical protein
VISDKESASRGEREDTPDWDNLDARRFEAMEPLRRRNLVYEGG